MATPVIVWYVPDPPTTKRRAFARSEATEALVGSGSALRVEDSWELRHLLRMFGAYLRCLTGPRSGQVRIAKVSLGVARLHDASPVAYLSGQLLNALGVRADEVRRVEEGVLAEKDLPDAAAVAYARSLARRHFEAAPELRDPLLRYFSRDEIEHIERATEAISTSCRTGWSLPALRGRLEGRSAPGSSFWAEVIAAAVHLLGLGPLVLRVSWLRRQGPLTLLRDYRSARRAGPRVIDLRYGPSSGETG